MSVTISGRSSPYLRLMDEAAPQRRYPLGEAIDLLPRRWVVKLNFSWAARFRWLARDDERLQTILEEFPSVAFTLLALHTASPSSPSTDEVHNRL